MGARKTTAILVLVVLLFTLMTLFYTRPLVSKADDHTMEENEGDTLFNIYVLTWTAHSLKTSPFNLFNASMFYPNRYTLAYSDHQFMSSLIALPVLALTRNGVLGFNFVIIFSFILSALGAYLLVYHLTRDHLGAFAGGVVFGFSMYKLAHINHMQLLSTGFLPLAILCLHLYTEKKKPGYALLFGACTIAMFLTVWSYGFFLVLAVGIYLAVLALFQRKLIWRIIRRDALPGERKRAFRWTAWLLASFLLIGVVLTPFTLPYLKARELNPNFERDLSEIYGYSADPGDFLVAPPQSMVWGSATGFLRPDPYTRGNASERSLFTGLLPLFLSIAGIAWLVRKGRNKPFILWFYAVLMVVAVVMCLGVALYAFGRFLDLPMPYELLYRFFPGFKAIRTPARMFVLVLLSLSVFSGFGVRWLREKLSGRLGETAVTACLVVLIVLMFVEVLPSGIEMKRLETRAEFPAVFHWLAELDGPSPGVVLPLANYDPGSPSGMDDLSFAYMESHRIYHNTANWKKILNGYSGYVPLSYKKAVKATRDFPSERSLAHLRRVGIEYVIVEGERYEETELRRVLEDAGRSKGLSLVYESEGYYAYRLKKQDLQTE